MDPTRDPPADPEQAITLDDPEDSPGIEPPSAPPPSVEPIAWLADIDTPEASLPGWVLARIDRTAERFRDRWTPEQTAAFRRHMAWTLATHPRVRKVVEIVEGARRH